MVHDEVIHENTIAANDVPDQKSDCDLSPCKKKKKKGKSTSINTMPQSRL